MATLLIAITTNFTIRKKVNGVIFAQCNTTKKFVKTTVALEELQSETLNKKDNEINLQNIGKPSIDNFILVLCLLICSLSIGVIVFSWVRFDIESAFACSIVFSCTYLLPYLLAKNMMGSHYKTSVNY